jgi:hypothetical protein
MAGSTISNLVTISVTLGSGTYTSPLTITSVGYIDPFAGGSFGATGLVATIAGGSVLNQGTVSGAGGEGNFINPGVTTNAGGIGVELANGSLTNAGLIVGGNGKYDYTTGTGAAGGAGVIATDSSLSNDGTVLGGNGGTLPSGFSSMAGSPNGPAGDGVVLTNSSLSNQGVIKGGAGGVASYLQGPAAAGGVGVEVTGSSNVVNTYQINGGSGGYSEGGAAGLGGAGISLAAGGTLINSGGIHGGSGGTTYFGVVGAGGDGVDVTLASAINNAGISGGTGGTAGGFEFPAGGGTGGTGVNLTGGSLVNNNVISGGGGGLAIRGGGGTGGTGVSLSSGAILTNLGVIAGGGGNVAEVLNAVISSGGLGVAAANSTVVNDGLIIGGGNGSAGIDLTGGTIINHGSISSGVNNYGYFLGSGIYGSSGTIFNSGTIVGGYFSVAFTGGGTLINAGTIVCSDGYTPGSGAAVHFAGAGTDRLTVDPGAVFVGNVVAQGGVATLELASAASVGTITGIGTSFSGFGAVTIDPGATWTVTGSVTAGDTISLGAGGDLTFTNGVTAASPVYFTANTGTLGLGDPSGFLATAYGFRAGDAVDFTSITSAGSITAGVNGSNDLTLTSGGSLVAEIKLDPGQDFSGAAFHAASDGGAGTLITETTPLCFLAGTMIATVSGETPVERLCVGDRVVTARGENRPVVWIGTGRALATRGRRSAATPVIVRKGALGPNVPHTDLVVTKAHALSLDGVLIPVEFLVNHRTILWDDMAREVVLYHVELETHDVLLANGAPAESYRDDGNRWLFRNANSGWDLPAKPPCAPVLTGGELVDAAWLRLLRRAGPRPVLPLTDDPDLHLLVDGRRMEAVSRTGAFHVFRVAGRPDAIRIASRAAAPQELGLTRDPRCLGVALRRIIIRQGAQSRVTEADDPVLAAGFHAFEAANGCRWTDGDAVLPPSLFDRFDGWWEVVLQCEGTAHYIADEAKRNVA